MRDVEAGGLHVGSVAREAVAKLRRVDRRVYLASATYCLGSAVLTVGAAAVLSDLVTSIVAVSRELIATFIVVLAVLLLGWFAEPAVKRLIGWRKQDSRTDASARHM